MTTERQEREHAVADSSAPTCNQTGAKAIRGECPIHHGDGCLVASDLLKMEQRAEQAERLVVKMREELLGIVAGAVQCNGGADYRISHLLSAAQYGRIRSLLADDAAARLGAEPRIGTGLPQRAERAERLVGAMRAAVEDEEEFNGEIPDDLWDRCASREGATEIFRAAVRASKRNILQRMSGLDAARLGAEWEGLRECYRLLKANHDCATYDYRTKQCRGCAISDALAAVERARQP